MTIDGQQLPLDLITKDPFASRYFVLHSGVGEGCALVETCLLQLVKCKEASATKQDVPGVVFFVTGSAGVGKSHFIHRACERARELGIADIVVYDQIDTAHGKDSDWCRRFVAEYQLVIRNGGVLFVASALSSEELTEDPSVRSRLESAQKIELKNPDDQELPPILESIAERRNLQLSRRNIDYIVRRLPRNPLSFEHLFASIDQLCLQSGKPAKLQMIRSLLTSDS